MKKLLSLVVFIVFLALPSIKAQTFPTGTSNFNQKDLNGTYVVKWTLKGSTTDSTTVYTSPQFSIPAYNAYVASYPANFLVKIVPNYGAKGHDLLTVLAVRGAETQVIDSLRSGATNLTASDTTGFLTFNGNFGTTYELQYTNSGNSLTSGYIEVVFTRPVTGYIPDYSITK